MTKDYYFKNILIAIGIFAIVLIVWLSPPAVSLESIAIYLILLALNTVLFPFSKMAIESLFLSFTNKDFWTTGILTENAGKSGFYAIYYSICFALAIPVSLIYFVLHLLRRAAG